MLHDAKMKAARAARTRRAKAFARPPDRGRDSTIRTDGVSHLPWRAKRLASLCAHAQIHPPNFFSPTSHASESHGHGTRAMAYHHHHHHHDPSLSHHDDDPLRLNLRLA